MSAYYNEFDPGAAQWLRNLIDAGVIAPGIVDERSIEDVLPSELRGFTQCHFFAGVGVWSYALRNAGWPDSRPVWTGSCPCQPFSAAGKGAGFADERHLWPAFFHLIEQLEPAVVLGEQVASKDVDPWIDLVQDDLEAVGYAVGAVPFPSAGVGAPHIRDRCYWVADSHHAGLEGWRLSAERALERFAGAGSLAGWVADAAGERWDGRQDPAGAGGWPGLEAGGAAGGSGVLERAGPGPVNGFWAAADWLGCTDGSWRPVEPGSFPLAHATPGRVGRLRAYGNAINAEAARVFTEAVIERRRALGVFS